MATVHLDLKEFALMLWDAGIVLNNSEAYVLSL